MPEYPNSIKSKLPRVETTIFTIMSKLANDYKAINLSQGFPDFNCSEKLISYVNHYMKKGFNQYAPMQGVMALREVIAQKVEELYSIKYHPETEITITPGATYALYTAITAFIQENDEVVVFTPAYDCYEPAIELNGGKIKHIQLKAPNYTIDWNEVKKVVNRKTKMIIINTPHNPTGTILTANDIMKLDRLTKDSDIIVVSDEVYEHIIFDGYEHQSVARYPNLAERSIIVYSFGKVFHNTGWKMGYCLAPANLMREFQKVHQYNVFTCNTPIQYALADFLKEKDYLHLPAFYQQKRDFFNQLIKGSRFTLKPSSGTYFQLLKYNKISDEKDTDFAVRLTVEHGIASIPISVFYNEKTDNKVLRFCFAKSDETLSKAAEIINKI